MSGLFELLAGTELNIIVGQMGKNYASNNGGSGGGGASWAWITGAQEPLVVAGGGGGSRETAIDGTLDGHKRDHCLDGRTVANPFPEHCTKDEKGGWSAGGHCDGAGGGGWRRVGDFGGQSAMPGYPPTHATKPGG